tara:strand:- start:252 stop:944 length:693 start_codon:yes stop_codon:yes gene_type:complete
MIFYIVLSIIILVLILLINTSQSENFEDIDIVNQFLERRESQNEISQNNTQKTCNYYPKGRDELNCIEICMKNHKDCDFITCKETCLNCDDNSKCSWVLKEAPIEETDSEFIQEIFLKSKVYDKKIHLKWSPPNNEIIDYYVSYIYKTYKKDEGVTINMLSSKKCTNCSHIIDNLDEDEVYTVGVKAYKNNNLNSMSNLITFKPKETQYSNVYVPPEIPQKKMEFICENN